MADRINERPTRIIDMTSLVLVLHAWKQNYALLTTGELPTATIHDKKVWLTILN